MKSIGIVRKVDELGRIVLPIETRRQLGLEAKDGVEIFVDEDRIILKKYCSAETEMTWSSSATKRCAKSAWRRCNRSCNSKALYVRGEKNMKKGCCKSNSLDFLRIYFG